MTVVWLWVGLLLHGAGKVKHEQSQPEQLISGCFSASPEQPGHEGVSCSSGQCKHICAWLSIQGSNVTCVSICWRGYASPLCEVWKHRHRVVACKYSRQDSRCGMHWCSCSKLLTSFCIASQKGSAGKSFICTSLLCCTRALDYVSSI